MRAAVVVHHALGVACGAAGVVQGNGIPLVSGQLPGKVGVTRSHEIFVERAAQALRWRAVQIILHFNHGQRRLALAQWQRLGHDGAELRVHDHGLGFAMIEHESDGFRV